MTSVHESPQQEDQVLLLDSVPHPAADAAEPFIVAIGQANTGHVVRDRTVAQKFLDYWEVLSKDPLPDDFQAMGKRQFAKSGYRTDPRDHRRFLCLASARRC